MCKNLGSFISLVTKGGAIFHIRLRFRGTNVFVDLPTTRNARMRKRPIWGESELTVSFRSPLAIAKQPLWQRKTHRPGTRWSRPMGCFTRGTIGDVRESGGGCRRVQPADCSLRVFTTPLASTAIFHLNTSFQSMTTRTVGQVPTRTTKSLVLKCLSQRVIATRYLLAFALTTSAASVCWLISRHFLRS